MLIWHLSMAVHDTNFFRSSTWSSELSPGISLALETEPALRGPILNGCDHNKVGTCQTSTFGRSVLNQLTIGIDGPWNKASCARNGMDDLRLLVLHPSVICILIQDVDIWRFQFTFSFRLRRCKLLSTCRGLGLLGPRREPGEAWCTGLPAKDTRELQDADDTSYGATWCNWTGAAWPGGQGRGDSAWGSFNPDGRDWLGQEIRSVPIRLEAVLPDELHHGTKGSDRVHHEVSGIDTVRPLHRTCVPPQKAPMLSVQACFCCPAQSGPFQWVGLQVRVIALQEGAQQPCGLCARDGSRGGQSSLLSQSHPNIQPRLGSNGLTTCNDGHQQRLGLDRPCWLVIPRCKLYEAAEFIMAIFESAVMRDVVHMSQVTVAAPRVYHQYQMAANQPLLQVIGWVGHELLQLAHFSHSQRPCLLCGALQRCLNLRLPYETSASHAFLSSINLQYILAEPECLNEWQCLCGCSSTVAQVD